MESIEKILMSIIAVVIAVSVVGTVAGTVYMAQHSNNATKGTNVSGAGSVLLGLVTLLFVIGIMVLAIRKFISK